MTLGWLYGISENATKRLCEERGSGSSSYLSGQLLLVGLAGLVSLITTGHLKFAALRCEHRMPGGECLVVCSG
jgi:hypothetical protein